MKGYTSIKETAFELHTQYSADQINQFLRAKCVRGDFPVPTEFVIIEPKFCVPQMGRWFWSSLYLPKEYTRKQENDEYIVCVEIWEDEGDDGHTHMVLQGYAFFSERDMRIFEKVVERGERSVYGNKLTIHRLIESQIHEWCAEDCKDEWFL